MRKYIVIPNGTDEVHSRSIKGAIFEFRKKIGNADEFTVIDVEAYEKFNIEENIDGDELEEDYVERLTNDDMLLCLLRNIDGLEAAIIRERLVKMMEITIESINENPDAYNNPFISAAHYIKVAEKVNKYLGFDKK